MFQYTCKTTIVLNFIQIQLNSSEKIMFSTRNAHMVHIDNSFRLKMVLTS